MKRSFLNGPKNRVRNPMSRMNIPDFLERINFENESFQDMLEVFRLDEKRSDRLAALLLLELRLRTYSVREASAIVGVSEDMIRKAIRHKRLATVRIGKRNLRIPAWSLLEFVVYHECESHALSETN